MVKTSVGTALNCIAADLAGGVRAPRSFKDAGGRKAHPKLDKFNATMLERPLCKVSLPLKS